MTNVTSGAAINLGDELVDPAIELVSDWLHRANELESKADAETMNQLRDLILDENGVQFVMQFVDRVARPADNRVAAHQLNSLVASTTLPNFISAIDKVLLQAGSVLGPHLPGVVVPLARRRMRSIVGHLVAPAESAALTKHLSQQQKGGYDLNINLLGEAVLGEDQAGWHFDKLATLVRRDDIDYVSVKISAVASQLNYWDHAHSLERVTQRSAELLDLAAATTPPTFLNFDMEEYHDLELTVEAFIAVLDEPSRRDMDAGIVLQAYLPDVFDILQQLVRWANQRHLDGGGTIKIRLVKGANLAMEKVDAAIHGWEQAPYSSKIEADASYRRCLDWVLTPENLTGVRIGLASHNLFDVAWTKLLADRRGVTNRVQFEMLQGMASGQAKAVNEATQATASSSMLLYTPAVSDEDFDVAIGYLFRRLEENASTDNFMRALFDLSPGSAEFSKQAEFFRSGVELRHSVSTEPRRTQNRTIEPKPWKPGAPFTNEPDTDPSIAVNHEWIESITTANPTDCVHGITTDMTELEHHIDQARNAAERWAKTSAATRQEMLHRVGDEIARRRADFMVTMMHESSKTIAEADTELSEAIDFARWYADSAVEMDKIDRASFTPFGLVAVIPPWNFPVAIPAGGVFAALAAGNTAILKPAPQTPRCAELIAEACWAAGIPDDVVRFVRTPDNEVGQRLVTSADAVILTGSSETANLFRSWKADINLFAETSGKNAMIVTPSADLDLAARDLVKSAFGHAGQKCSAASLAILVGDVYSSDRFRRQVVDAAQSLTTGLSTHLSTDIAPLVDRWNERLLKAADQLEPGETWLLKPSFDGEIMSPGIRDGVEPGSWFHKTECFGPILGLVKARDLDHAIEIANSSDFGLTGGIQSLDPLEVSQWLEKVEIGNCYVNRSITGAIVRRQPFGGWKRSSVGPGAKAGGPNYLSQLGHWEPTAELDDYNAEWKTHFSVEHDETGLDCEANIFRYRPLSKIGMRVGPSASTDSIRLAKKAAKIAGVEIVLSDEERETEEDFLAKLTSLGIERVRLIGSKPSSAFYQNTAKAGIYLATEPVTPAGRVELQYYVREQSVSETLHRFGNLISTRPPG